MTTPYITERTDQALARAAKALLALNLTREQADAVVNVLRDVISVVALDVGERVSAEILTNARRLMEQRIQEANDA